MAKKPSNSRKKQNEADKVETVDLKSKDIIEDAEVVAEAPLEEAFSKPEDLVEDAIEDNAQDSIIEEVSETSDSYESAPPHPPVENRQGGFIPMVLGGLIAGVIGFGIATFQRGDNTVELERTIATQSDDIAALQDEVEALAARPQTDGIIAQVAALVQANDTLSDRFGESVAALDARMTIVEKQPSADGTLQEAAVAAYERDIAALREQISAQQDEMRGLLTETRQEAQSSEENAIATARRATARASLAIVQGALETGDEMGAVLIDLQGAIADPLPDALQSATNGVKTLSELQGSFPALARAALATARSEGASGEDVGGLSGFLRSQLDVRSVEPKAGNSADAVLSRSEAALRDGRLNDTLAELASLPEVARSELSEWIGQAEQRAAALDAVATLAAQLNVN